MSEYVLLLHKMCCHHKMCFSYEMYSLIIECVLFEVY